MGTEQGIDVAWPQGARFGWPQWKGKIQFGACKATEEFNTDPDFTDNWQAMWELSTTLPRFAYAEFHAATDARDQAAYLVATVKRAGLLPGDNFMAAFEPTDGTGLNDGITPFVFADRAVTFLKAVNGMAPGHRVLPYMDPSFALAGNADGMSAWYLWLANYGVTTPQIPQPWTRWTFWQHGDEPLDLDSFNGTEAQLLKFCRMPDGRG